MEYLFNLLFPAKCHYCTKFGQLICEPCLNKTKMLMEKSCIHCDKTSITGNTHIKCQTNYSPTSIFYLFEYEGVTRDIIRKAKYGNREFSLLKCLVRFGIEVAIHSGMVLEQGTVVIPIPLSKNRLAKRGFNQAEVIASEVAKRFGLELSTNVLTRPKNSKPQFSKNKAERFDNIKGAFQINNAENVKKRKILLVDDISTSGATLLEACKAISSRDLLELDCFILSKKHLETSSKH